MIKAIETRYKGYRFRSRLEARWAVFMDYLHIPWEYETQGFECEKRITAVGSHEKINYLPDFYLPNQGRFMEVKNPHCSTEEAFKTIDCAASISSGLAGGCHDEDRSFDVIVATKIPSSEDWYFPPIYPVVLHMHKGSIMQSEWSPLTYSERNHCPVGHDVCHDTGDFDYHPKQIITMPMYNCGAFFGIEGKLVERACKKARSARFEHGERG